MAATSWDEVVVVGTEVLDTVFAYEAMNGAITGWADQIADLVDADPLLNRARWEAEVDAFRQVLQKAVDEFEAHLEEGYVIEE